MNEQTLGEEIRSLVGEGNFNRSLLTAMLKDIDKEEQEKRKRQRQTAAIVLGGPCTIYTQIKRIYTCTHCGSKKESIVELKKGESVPICNKEGKVTIITSTSPCQVDALTSSCEKCEEFVGQMDREELERRYMVLLRQATFFVQSMNIEDGEKREVRL